jgi:CMP-N,N'-diacetyllegionaminic acid synthase
LDIENTINVLLDDHSADSAVSVVEVSHMLNPIKLKKLSGKLIEPYLEEEKGRMMANQLDKVYVRNCSVYASWLKTIQEGTIVGNRCLAYEMPKERSVDINDSFDFQFASFLKKKIN